MNLVFENLALIIGTVALVWLIKIVYSAFTKGTIPLAPLMANKRQEPLIFRLGLALWIFLGLVLAYCVGIFLIDFIGKYY